jgi:hypothetical protein
MAAAQIVGHRWVRQIHDTWANTSGWRTDIAKSVLDDLSVTEAVFVLDDKRALFLSMAELRAAVSDCPIRGTGKVGPFEVDPQSSRVNGRLVKIEVRLPLPKKE